MTAAMEKENYWSQSWQNHIENYLSAPPRLANWLMYRFPSKDLSFIEIAGGSCRDTLELHAAGYNAQGADFDTQTLDYLRRRFPKDADIFVREDAFALSLPDKSRDISFSNGFWILFQDDDKIRQLVREQTRIASRFAIFICQNADCPGLVRQFADLAKTDDLYDIRFYQREEMRRLIDSSGIEYKSMTFNKFGGPTDLLYLKSIKGIPNPFEPLARQLCPRLYELQPWNRTQRIACIVETR
jgi:hypothetical protein